VTAFDAAATAAAAPLLDWYGETFSVTPMRFGTDPNAAPAPDTSRQPFDLRAIWVDDPGELRTPNAYDLRSQHRPGVRVGKPAIDIADPAIDLRRGDVILRQADGTRWRIGTGHTGAYLWRRIPIEAI